MKIFKIILFLFLSMSISLAYAKYETSHYVTGYDEYGGRVYGTLYSDFSQQNLYGEVTDENGNTQFFIGDWVTDQHIRGQNDEGTSVDLNLY